MLRTAVWLCVAPVAFADAVVVRFEALGLGVASPAVITE